VCREDEKEKKTDIEEEEKSSTREGKKGYK